MCGEEGQDVKKRAPDGREHVLRDATLEFRRLEPGDAPALVRCLRRCYGDTYLHRDFYDLEAIRSLLQRGLLHSGIAVDESGEVVAHLGMLLERVGDRTADMVLGIVDPRYRGQQLILRTGAVVAPEFERLGLTGLYQYATTAHETSQKLTLATRSVETGMLLGFLPEATTSMQTANAPPPWRLPAIMLYLPLAAAPRRTAHVPRCYREVVSDIYARVGLERRLADEDLDLSRRPARLRSVIDAPRGRIRIVVEAIGEDLVPEVARWLRDPGASSMQIAQLDLPLSDPATPSAVEALRELGFFFGGVLPEFSEGDVLRLQSVRSPAVDFTSVALVSEVGKRLLDFVLADRAQVLARTRNVAEGSAGGDQSPREARSNRGATSR
jgi:serine/threonine-protein kinase RsbW